MQHSLIDLMRPQPTILPVDPDGEVVPEGLIHAVLELPHPKLAYPQARIEIHPKDEQWMWATSYSLDNDGGRGYRVGPKWGKFAPSAEDAIYWAAAEIREAVKDASPSKGKRAILKWVEEVTMGKRKEPSRDGYQRSLF